MGGSVGASLRNASSTACDRDVRAVATGVQHVLPVVATPTRMSHHVRQHVSGAQLGLGNDRDDQLIGFWLGHDILGD